MFGPISTAGKCSIMHVCPQHLTCLIEKDVCSSTTQLTLFKGVDIAPSAVFKHKTASPFHEDQAQNFSRCGNFF
jgi:hypothetical protein